LTEHIKSGPVEIKKFGILFTIVFLLLASYLAWKGHGVWPWFLGGAAFFLVTGFFFHSLLRPVYIGWMKFAFVLGWINTRLILGIFFYLVLTPVGLFMRLIGRDALHRKFDRKATTYWVKREPAEFKRERYEQLF
jgi:multisubunit Na+/H+ antiporter MnhG subunit